MSRLEGFSTWDLVNNTIGVGPLKRAPQDSTDTWFATYIDFDTDYNAFTHEVVAVFGIKGVIYKIVFHKKKYLYFAEFRNNMNSNFIEKAQS